MAATNYRVGTSPRPGAADRILGVTQRHAWTNRPHRTVEGAHEALCGAPVGEQPDGSGLFDLDDRHGCARCKVQIRQRRW